MSIQECDNPSDGDLGEMQTLSFKGDSLEMECAG